MRVGRNNAENPAKDSKKTEACGDHPHPRPAGEAQSEAFGQQPTRFN